MSMKVFAKTFEGVRDGEIYPTSFQPGDQCPPELEPAAAYLGVLAVEGKAPEEMNIPELKAALDAKNITYVANAKKDELLAALVEALKPMEGA